MTRVNLICAAPFHGGLWQSHSSFCPQLGPVAGQGGRRAGGWGELGAAGATLHMRLVQQKAGEQGGQRHCLFSQDKCRDKLLSISLSPCKMDF